MKKLILIILIHLFFLFNSGFAQDFWEVIELPDGIDLWDVKTNSSNDLFIGTNRGVLCRRHDEINWDTLLYASNEGINALFIDESDHIFAGSRKLYYSANNGHTWTPLFESSVFGITSIFRNSVGAVYIGLWGGIYKCDTIGADFIPVLTFNNSEVVNSIIEDTITGVMFCGTINYFSGGGIYISTDGGNNWVQDGLTGHFVSSLALNSTGDLFAGTRGGDFGTGGVFKMPYGQTEWIQLNNQELVTSQVINSENEIFIGCSDLSGNGGVRYSADNGITWESIIEGMGGKDIEKLSIREDGYVYAVARNSDEQLFKSIESTVTHVKSNRFDRNISMFNYPNPFTNETTIFFSKPIAASNALMLSVYNSCGMKVWEQSITINHSIIQHIRLKGEHLQKGVYLYTVSDEVTRLCGKMVVY